jgi:hypothetical protein
VARISQYHVDIHTIDTLMCQQTGVQACGIQVYPVTPTLLVVQAVLARFVALVMDAFHMDNYRHEVAIAFTHPQGLLARKQAGLAGLPVRRAESPRAYL